MFPLPRKSGRRHNTFVECITIVPVARSCLRRRQVPAHCCCCSSVHLSQCMYQHSDVRFVGGTVFGTSQCRTLSSRVCGADQARHMHTMTNGYLLQVSGKYTGGPNYYCRIGLARSCLQEETRSGPLLSFQCNRVRLFLLSHMHINIPT